MLHLLYYIIYLFLIRGFSFEYLWIYSWNKCVCSIYIVNLYFAFILTRVISGFLVLTRLPISRICIRRWCVCSILRVSRVFMVLSIPIIRASWSSKLHVLWRLCAVLPSHRMHTNARNVIINARTKAPLKKYKARKWYFSLCFRITLSLEFR